MGGVEFHNLALTDADMRSHAACLACGGEKARPYSRFKYDGRSLVHHLCPDCGLVYMNPYPAQNWYDRLYGAEFWEVKAKHKRRAVTDNVPYWTKALKRADKYTEFLARHSNGVRIVRLLEIGAAYGIVGRSVGDRLGAEVFAVEPNDAARDFAVRHLGVSIAGKTVADVAAWAPDEPVDMILFSHVLENIVDVHGTLTDVSRVLRPGGMILIETPNVRFTRSMSLYHPYCFCVTALEVLLGRHGYRIDAVSRSGRPASLLAPRYLTVLAVRGDGPVAVRGSGTAVRARTRLGQAWLQFMRLPPAGQIDVLAARSAYGLSEHSRGMLAKLEEGTSSE